MTIRPAKGEDEEALRALDEATWAPDVTPGPRESGQDRSFFGPDEDPNDVLVAEVEGEVAGYIKLRNPTGLESNQHVLAILGLAVDPARQRQGIARALLDAAAEEAAGRGARRLTLRVLAPNSGARALYESCGFEVEGVMRDEFFLDGRYVDDVQMARRLV